MQASFRRWLGTAGGLGWLPVAPGTWGSLGTVLVVGLVLGVEDLWAGWWAPADPRLSVGLAAGTVLVLGTWVGQYAAADWGRKDPGAFVLDEVVGQLLPVLPLLPGTPSLLGLAVAFGLFRLFDILKPPPCRLLETLPAGVGIMADDVAAGLYALIIVALLGL